MDDEMIERCAKAAYDELNAQTSYVGEYKFPNGNGADTCLDGDFNLIEMVKAVVKAMREPTEKMKHIVTDDMVITDKCYYCGGHIDGWRTMIDSITKEDLCIDEGCPQHGTEHICK